MELHVRYEGDDDPDKCTARTLARFGLAELHRSARATPAGLVLDPHADVALSPADDQPVTRRVVGRRQRHVRVGVQHESGRRRPRRAV